MVQLVYEVEQQVGTFEEGTVLEVTAQYGDWHRYDVKLTPPADEGGSVELTWDRLREHTSPVKITEGS